MLAVGCHGSSVHILSTTTVRTLRLVASPSKRGTQRRDRHEDRVAVGGYRDVNRQP